MVEDNAVMPIEPGAWNTTAYLPLLNGKKVAMVVNQTSRIGGQHLVDSLYSLGVNIGIIFAPEHGFRGEAEAGANIQNEVDEKTGIRIISIYGKKKKPSADDLKDMDVILFDIQDVGARFYTYISTLEYIMDASAETHLPLIVLDRPNPNGHYVDGPVLDTTFRSFVGMQPVPVVYGMTIGEYARMLNGEHMIKQACELTVIPCRHYDHTMLYALPVRPSPNLPNIRSILLYPGICFFEGTMMSLGRGTNLPFEVVGHPEYPDHRFSFTPVSMTSAVNPPLKDKLCYGLDFSEASVDSLFLLRKLDLSILLQMYSMMPKDSFFDAKWFDTLAGSSSLRLAIQSGQTEAQIRERWRADLEKFKQVRKKYLLYEDFRE